MAISQENNREELLSSVHSLLERQELAVPDTKLAATFADLFFARIPTDELEQRDPGDLAALAAAVLRFGRKRQPGIARVRAYNPARDTDGWETRYTIVEIVNDDMPFLVDSASMAVTEHRCTVHLTIHPTCDVVRDDDGTITTLGPPGRGTGAVTESFVYMEIDRQSSPHALRRIRKSIERALSDVRAAVGDWSEMRDKALEVSQEIGQSSADMDPEWLSENRDLVEWMARDHFTFLGYRQYDLRKKGGELWLYPDNSTGLGLLNPERSGDNEGRKISDEAQALVNNPELIVFTKTNARATVHRTGSMDYVGVMRFDGRGRIIGEHRFLGLFTSGAYSRPPRDIPLLRLKVRNVLQRSDLSTGGHGGKALAHILDTLPRDELFQGTEEEIYTLALGILNLQERRQTRLFIRKGRFGRFFSCLVYIPRDRFNTEVREEIQGILRRALKGVRLDYTVQVFDTPLARVQVLVRTRPGEVVDYDVVEIEQRLVEAVRSWQDQLQEILTGKVGEEEGAALAQRFGHAFPAAYTEDVRPWVASFDVLNLAGLRDENDLGMSLYRPRKRGGGILRFKVFRYDHTIPLSDAVPMLENMGLRIVSERPYELHPADGRTMWIQDFDMIPVTEGSVKPEQVKDIFQETFLRVWRGDAEADGFNRLVLGARLDWRQVSVIRAVCKYLLQTGLPFSQPYMEQTLASYPVIARLLAELFETRFDPRYRDREKASKVLQKCLQQELEEVRSLDADRILRSFIGVLGAMTRTNYFQKTGDGQAKPAFAFKLDPSKVPELPEPRPMFEIFVYAPHMEGIHLRGGEVARGGLRWSDRREDFRTEVLGLMKAQMVKNTVIVPVGAKGGFVLKRSTEGGDRDALLAEGVRCYRHFISSLLDVTDNIVDGVVVPPTDVIRYDGDDPYLVVAADKGTATFSDIANETAEGYGFWLGDAFASGGSVGYDHKKMGITARGAWESVMRHFREMGRDIQSEPFDVVGIGDMSGDVFGNGMLLSPYIRLKAAFNHLHIFIDPDPDPAVSYAERERLFELPRSGWADYDPKLISKGGGVWSRQDKNIPLSAEVRDWLGLEKDQLAPNELIRHLLQAPVDLLWNGGIGTYVKARSENNADAGDHANDALRVNGGDLRCQVVGEGGNLGFTQRGRVEYALNGGRMNTDFIDNAAGVDCSDHEVNIKILLNDAMRAGRLNEKLRPKLMASMTEEVARLVLRSNYLQTQALSMMEAQAVVRLGEYGDFVTLLERKKVLSRDLENLPDAEGIVDRKALGKGLTRPELSTLLSFAKITIYEDLLRSDVPEDPYLSRELVRYFPKVLQRDFHDLMPRHGLKRQIIATQVTNSIVNRMGVTFAHRMMGDTGADCATVTRAYTIAREILDARSVWTAIESLDNRVACELQINLILDVWQLLRHITRWLLNRRGLSLDIAAGVERFHPGIKRLVEILPELFTDERRGVIEQEVARLSEAGVTDQLARHMACLRFLYAAPDVVEISVEHSVPVERVAQVYMDVGKYLSLRWLRDRVECLSVESQWHARARGALRDELYGQHRYITARVLAEGDIRNQDIVDEWMGAHNRLVDPIVRMYRDMRTMEDVDFATVTVAVRSLDNLLRDGAAATGERG